jgi:RNA polymerase sigma-70 factor, ECF subfamily
MRPSFEAVFEAEFPALHRYLRRRVGASTADDLTAATFATAYANWKRLDTTRPVRPWLYGIAANLVRRHWRDEERMLRAYARTGIDPVFAEDDETFDRLDARSHQRELAAALASLRPNDREILLLHAWAEFSDTEIAAALSLPLGTVKSRLYRTRERLRNRLSVGGQSAANTSIATVEERR